MAKTTPSRTAVQAAPQPAKKKPHIYVPALISDNFGRLSILTADTANPFVAKKLDSASRRLQIRAEEKLGRDQLRDYVLAERGLTIEFREAEQARRMGRRLIGTKVRPEKIRHRPPKERQRGWPHASRALPKYSGLVLDRKGERGVFVRIRYYSRKTAEAGVSSRVVKYVFNGAELDAAGQPYFVSNVGRDVDEAHCAFDHLEQVNWAAQKNAKLLMHAIMAVDYRQTPDDMMRTGVVWAEEALGRFGLPYVVTLHAPPEDGDERNWHLHILFSFRPLARVGDRQWEVGEMLRTDLDNPQAMRLMREMYASVMTITSFESGINQPYTAKSNAARGLVHEPQEHLGGARTNMVRNGHHIAKNEENFERVMRSEAAALDEDLRHVDEALAREQEVARGIRQRWSRIAATLPQVPQRIMASLVNIDMPVITPVPPASVPFVAPALELPVRSEVFRFAGLVDAVVEPVKAAPTNVERYYPPSIPVRSVILPDMPPLEIANLRLPMRQADAASPLPAIANPVVRPLVPAISVQMPISPLLAIDSAPDLRMVSPPRAHVPAPVPYIFSSGLPAVQRVPHMPQRLSELPVAIRGAHMPPAVPIQRPSSVADTATLGLSIARINDALEDHGRREEDRAAVDKARQMAVARAADEERRRQALDSLLAQIIAERRAINRRDGKRRVEAELLARHGLVQDDIVTEEVQAQLDNIARERALEVGQLAEVGREAVVAQGAAPPQGGHEADAPRRQSLAGWLRAATHADRIAALDDDEHWPRRRRENEGRPAGSQIDTGRKKQLPITLQGPDL